MPRYCASCEIPLAFLPRPWTHATVKDETPPRNSWPQGMYTAFPKPFTGDSQPGKEFGQAQIAYTNQTFELGGKDESEGYSEAKNVRRGGWVLRHGHAWSFGGDVHAEPEDCCVRRFLPSPRQCRPSPAPRRCTPARPRTPIRRPLFPDSDDRAVRPAERTDD